MYTPRCHPLLSTWATYIAPDLGWKRPRARTPGTTSSQEKNSLRICHIIYTRQKGRFGHCLATMASFTDPYFSSQDFTDAATLRSPLIYIKMQLFHYLLFSGSRYSPRNRTRGAVYFATMPALLWHLSDRSFSSQD
jgi:hypothetical protein